MIDKPVLRLTSVDLKATAEISSLSEVFDFARDYLGLLKNRGVYRALVEMNTAHRNTLDILRGELSGLRAVRAVFASASRT